jgi:hypothetical protein
VRVGDVGYSLRNDALVGGAFYCWQGLLAHEVHFVADGSVREITLGEAASFVGNRLASSHLYRDWSRLVRPQEKRRGWDR